MDVNQLLKLSQKPELFERSETSFWDDPHISKKMLEAHLNPDWNAASRKTSVIDKSVEWLAEHLFLIYLQKKIETKMIWLKAGK